MRHSSTYTEVLDVRKDLVVESEVITGNDVDTGILLDLPVGKTKTLSLSKEVSLGEVASPVFNEVSNAILTIVMWLGRSVFRNSREETYKLRWPSSGHGSHPYGGNPE